MNKLLVLLPLCALLFSCKKENKDKSIEENKKYPISFNVNGFTQSSTPIAVNADSKEVFSDKKQNAVVTFYYTRLMFIVYDASGKQVSRLEQTLLASNDKNLYRISNNTKKLVNTNNFGSITDTLAAGQYTLVVVGCSPNAGLNRPRDGSVSPAYSDLYPTADLAAATLYPSAAEYTEETFLYKGSLIVNNTMGAQTIKPTRITGKITLNIEDEIPANASYVLYNVNNNYGAIQLSNNALLSRVPDNLRTGYTLKAIEKGKPGFQVSWNILNTTSPITAIIAFYDVNNNLLVTKTIDNIVVKPNENTLVTGNVFTPNVGNFTINVNQDWGTGSTLRF